MQDSQENKWSKGINQDLSKTLISSDTYFEANNLRLGGTNGLTLLDLENIKGNINSISFPNISNTQKLTINQLIPGSISIQIFDGTNTDIGSTPFVVTSNSTSKDLYTYLTTNIGYVFLNSTYTIYYNNLYVLLLPREVPTITITLGGGSPTSIILDSNFLPAINNFEVIGSTSIDDTIYILTTDNHSKSPGKDDAISYGQIWKLTLDRTKDPFINTLTLLYNNALNFSTYNAIAPSAIIGRYENPGIQRIYWTDNFNKLRSLNVANPQIYATDLSTIDLIPSVDFDIPLLTNIVNASGSVKVGCYQIAYRLLNTSGAVTNYSELSNMIFVSASDEAANTGGAGFKDYIMQVIGTNTTKSITWIINNIDQDFDRIEVVIVIRDSSIAIPTINTFIDSPITGNNMSFTYDGNQTETNVVLSDFLLLSSTFTHAKTLTSKDNRLLVGNIRNEQGEIVYDARAFRAKTSTGTDIYLTNEGTQNLYNPTTAAALDETSDTINDYSNANAGYYKPGTNIIGGAGVNISYDFYTIATAADIESTTNFNIPDFTNAPWRHTNPNYTTNSLKLDVISPTNIGTNIIQTYNTQFSGGLINAGFKYPPVNSLFRGYLRNEIYRFGIQFYDKSKNPYFVKWIGDIKMPNYTDTCIHSIYEDGTNTGVNDFRLSFVANHAGGYREAFVLSLGIRFTVNIPSSLTNQIDGYSIVRVLRSEQDKTIINNGYITRCSFGGSGDIYTTTPLVDSNLNTTTTTHDDTKGFYITPDFSNLSGTTPSSSMIMRLRGVLFKTNTVDAVNLGGTDPYYFNKLYGFTPISRPDYTILQATILEFGQSTTELSISKQVHNYDFDTIAPNEGVSQSIGNKAYYIFAQNGILGVDWAAAIAANGKYYVAIERTLTTQYGGNTYTQRSNNEYIICNHYRPIRTSNSDISDTFEVYGGDTFINMYDSCRMAKNWGSATTRPVSSKGKFTTTIFFPVESVINTDLRYGTYMNKDIVTTYDTPSGHEFIENYAANGVTSTENDIKKYFPKPDPYIINTEYNNRFYISDIKINGELKDSWSIFKSLNYWDVEGSYGPITACGYLQDNIYFTQDKAFGKLLVNPKTAINSTDGTEIQIGRGNVIDSHDYISIEYGTRHQFSFILSAYSLYFIDARHKKIFSFNQNKPLNPLSDIKGMSSWVRNNLFGYLETTDRPVYYDLLRQVNGIHGVFDYLNDELLYTFQHSDGTIDKGFPQYLYTLVYNEKLECFTGFYSNTPRIFITNHQDFYSPNRDNSSDLYLNNYGTYGRFYENYYDSNISFFINKYPEVTKVFNNFILQTEMQDGNTLVDIDSGLLPIEASFNKLEVSTDFQSNSVTLVPNSTLKRRFRTWYTEVPKSSLNAIYMSSGFFAKMRDKVLKVKFSFTNNSNYRFIIHSINTLFSLNIPK